VPAGHVLRLVDETGHSAYDCEYVALAQRLGVPLVTGDRQLARQFPETAALMETFVGE
jgi:predicted nucleic acid-binding protein